MRFLHFILSHSIFIAACAAALCYQTSVLLHLPHDPAVYAFVFFSTLCSYNVYWLLSKFYFSDRSSPASFLAGNRSTIIIFLTAAAGSLYFLAGLRGILPYITAGGVLTLLYSLPLWPFPFSKHLQRQGYFKTILLSFNWAFVTVFLPCAASPVAPAFPVAILFVARWFFMLVLCAIFDLRDITIDRVHGLHSLATDLGRKRLQVVINIIFVLFVIAGMAVRFYYRDDLQLIAFAATVILTAFVYRQSLHTRGYLFYYFLVDGLMIIAAFFSAVANLFATLP